MRATLKAVRSKCEASTVPASARAMRRRSAAFAMRPIPPRTLRARRNIESYPAVAGHDQRHGSAQYAAPLRLTRGERVSARLAPRARLLGGRTLGRALAALDRQQHLALTFRAFAALLALRRL